MGDHVFDIEQDWLYGMETSIGIARIIALMQNSQSQGIKNSSGFVDQC